VQCCSRLGSICLIECLEARGAASWARHACDKLPLEVPFSCTKTVSHVAHARRRLDMGTCDELSLDVLINSFMGYSRDLAGLRRVVVGGANPDWPLVDTDEDEELEPQVGTVCVGTRPGAASVPELQSAHGLREGAGAAHHSLPCPAGARGVASTSAGMMSPTLSARLGAARAAAVAGSGVGGRSAPPRGTSLGVTYPGPALTPHRPLHACLPACVRSSTSTRCRCRRGWTMSWSCWMTWRPRGH